MKNKSIKILLGMFLLLFATRVRAQLSTVPGWHRISSASPSYGTAPCGGGAQGNPTYMDPANFPNNLNSSFPSYGFNFPGECQSFINDSNGGVLDTTRHRLILYGGGHSNYWGNDVVSLELKQIGGSTTPMYHLNHSALPVASVVCPGTNSGIVTLASGAVCSYPSAGGTVSSVFGLPHCSYTPGCFPTQTTVPASGHTYQGIVYIPPIISNGMKFGDEMLDLLSSTTPNGNGAGSAWLLEMNSVLSTCAVTATATAGCNPNWVALGSGPAGNNFYLNPLNVGMVAAYDPNAKGVWMQDQAHLQFYDPIAKTVTTKSSNGINAHATGVIDPIDNYFIFVGDNVPIRYEVLATPYTIVTPTTTNCSGYTSLSNIQYSGAAWDPISKTVMIYPNQGNVMYRLDPKTWTCTSETFGTTQGVDYPQNTDTHLGGTEGTFGHFQYDPGLDIFVMCNLYNDDCWYLVPPRGDPLICNGTWSNGTCSGGSSQTNTPITVSQPFRQGDIPSGLCPLVYQDSSGASTSTTTQVDAKNFWPDGSLKFGMISFIIPSMSANQVVRAVYRTQTCPSNAGFMTKTNMLATTGAPPGVNQNWNFDGQIQLTGTASHNISARTILNAATSCTDPTNGDIEGAIIASECVYWLKGPIVTAVILTDGSTSRSQDVNTDAGTGNPLHPIFEAWFWPQTGDVQLGYTLENAWASNTGTSSARDQTFSLVLTAGNTSPITLSGSWGASSQTMITRTAFHRTYCANGAKAGTQNSCSPVTIDHDYPYLAKTLFFPNWDPTLQQNPSYLTALVTNFNAAGTNKGIAGTTSGVGFYPGSNGCGASNTTSTGDGCTSGGFNQTGAAYFHGPLTTWEIICLMTSDPSECGTVNIGNSDLGYEVPYFYREADTGTGHGGWFDASNANSATPTAGTVSTFGRVVSINNRTQVNLQASSTHTACNTTYANDFVTFGTGGEDTGAFNGNTGTSHWANLALVSYVFTGQYAYYEEQMMQAAYAIGQAGDYDPLSTRSCFQLTANGSLRMGAAGYWQVDQERGNDWSGRENALGAFLAIDGSPESTYFIDKLKTNLAVWEGVHSITCDLGAGGVTYSYCTGSGFGTSQSAWSYGNTSRVSNSNAGGTTLGSWAIGPAISNSGGYEVQYPFCWQTTGTGAAGVLNPSLTGGGLSTPVSGPFFQNGDCPTVAPTTPPQAANSNFQNAYSTVTIGWINDLGFCPGACAMLQYVANFWINSLVNPAANPFLTSNYAYPTLDTNGAQFTSWASANASSLYVANGAPTGWIARQATAGCPSGTSGAADEWFTAESAAATSYVSALTENFSGSNFLGADAYNVIRNSDAIQICLPYFTNTGLVTSPKNFGSPKWDIVPRTTVQGSAALGDGLIDNVRKSSGTGGLGNNGWSQAGVQTGNPATGALPSATYTQCGSTIAAGATPAAIQSALNACAANQFILLGPGTFNFPANTGIIIRSNKAIRGSGADQTFIVAALGAGNSIGCQISALFCIQGTSAGDFVPLAGVNWTAGFAQGTNQITLASAAGIVAGSMILLDQCSTGLSGSPCTPESAEGPDNGNYFDCNIVQVTAWNSAQTYVNSNAVTYATTGHWYTVVANSNPPAGTAPPATGSSAFWADQGVAPLGTFGCAVNGDDRGNQRLFRPQTEVFLVSSVLGNVVTLNGTLKNPNWDLSHTPQAVLLGPPAVNSGVENLSIDMTATGSNGAAAIMILDGANDWARGVRVVNAAYAAFRVYEGTHFTFQDNYVYGTTRPGGQDSDAFVITGTSDGLIQNNIAQYLQTFFLAEGGDTGTVVGHNFMVNNFNGNNNGINPAIFPHAGDRYELFENNCMIQYYGEDFHGPKLMNTLFRNCFWGWESGANLPTPVIKNSGTQAIRSVAYSRYLNGIGGVYGTPGYHNAYQNGSQTSVIILGGGNTSNAGTLIPSDPVVAASSYLYSNYDVSNGGETRYCLNSSSTGWVSICGSASEVPTGFTPFGQSAPTVGDTGIGQTPLPASLYLKSKPSWYLSLPFPAVGPDVTLGNVGQCTGTLNVTGHYAGVAATSSSQCVGTGINMNAWGGHVNTPPAMKCFLTTMNLPPDGSNITPGTFNADRCYVSGSLTQVATPTFSPGTSNQASPIPVTITSATSGATICYTNDGTTPTANGAGICTHGTTLTNGGTVTVSFSQLLQAIGSESGFNDSNVGSAKYTFPTVTLGTLVAQARK